MEIIACAIMTVTVIVTVIVILISADQSSLTAQTVAATMTVDSPADLSDLETMRPADARKRIADIS